MILQSIFTRKLNSNSKHFQHYWCLPNSGERKNARYFTILCWPTFHIIGFSSCLLFIMLKYTIRSPDISWTIISLYKHLLLGINVIHNQVRNFIWIAIQNKWQDVNKSTRYVRIDISIICFLCYLICFGIYRFNSSGFFVYDKLE